jgi:hypothetical protein
MAATGVKITSTVSSSKKYRKVKKRGIINFSLLVPFGYSNSNK